MMAADDGDYDESTWWCGFTEFDGGVWCGGNKNGPRSYFVEETNVGTGLFGTDPNNLVSRDVLPSNNLEDMRGNLK